jgi:hypothetical protein
LVNLLTFVYASIQVFCQYIWKYDENSSCTWLYNPELESSPLWKPQISHDENSLEFQKRSYSVHITKLKHALNMEQHKCIHKLGNQNQWVWITTCNEEGQSITLPWKSSLFSSASMSGHFTLSNDLQIIRTCKFSCLSAF